MYLALKGLPQILITTRALKALRDYDTIIIIDSNNFTKISTTKVVLLKVHPVLVSRPVQGTNNS